MQKEDDKRQMKIRWVIFLVLALGYFFVYFHRVSTAVVAPDLVQAFTLSGAGLGVLASAYFYSYTLMQIPVGLLADSLGPRKTVTFFMLLASVGAVLFGLSVNYTMAVLSRILVGLGVAALFVPTLKILAEWFRIKEFAMLTGILMAIGGLGSMAANTPLAFCSEWLGWRLTFILIGCFSLIIAVLAWIIVRNKPQDMGFEKLVEDKEQGPELQITLGQSLKRVLTEKYFWPLALWFFFSYGAIIGYWGLWGGPYMIQIHGLSKSQAGNVLLFVAIGMLFGSPFLGWLSDKVFQARKPVVQGGSLLYVLSWVVLVFWGENLPIFSFYLISFCMGIGGCAMVIVVFTANKELFPTEIAGTSTGLVNTFPFAGGAVFPPIMGYIMDTVGKADGVYPIAAFKYAFGFCLLAAVIGLVCACLMRETLSREEKS